MPLSLKSSSIIQVHPSAARTATFNTGIFDLSKFRNFSSLLTVTARSGTTPTLAVQYFVSGDQTNWFNLSTLSIGNHVAYNSGSTIPSVDMIVFDITVPYIRATCTIAGTTPSWTFQLDVSAY